VYGAGVQGSLYAARLAETGHDVTLLARGARLEMLGARGVVLEGAPIG
jgi:2-dehydropantoate 2-reductase